MSGTVADLIAKTALAEAAGFSLYMLRAVMDGRARELIDLARTNLLR